MLFNSLFAGLIRSSSFFRIVFPHLKPEYFPGTEEKILHRIIKTYYEKYNKVPTFPDLKLLVDTDELISIDDTETLQKRIVELSLFSDFPEEEVLVGEVEKWVQTRALELAILDSVDIMEKGKERGGIETKIKEALAIQFVINLGHDYLEDAYERMNSYLEKEDKIPLDIELINVAMGGGLVKKAQFIFMANTNVGKTTILCHCASALLMSGVNVLYISAEMSEKEISKRVDANCLDMDISSLNMTLDKTLYKSRFKSLVERARGKLIVKGVPTGSAHAHHVRNIIHEIKLKKGWVPDVVIMDGLNNFASYKIPAALAGSPIYVKNVAEEMRALAQELDFAELTVCQFNRGAKAKKTDVDLEDVGEAYAISQTTDWAGAVIQTDELREQGKYLVKNAKTRFGKNKGAVYTVGIDFDKMRLTNLAEDEQELPMHIKDQLKYQQKIEDEKEEKIIFDFTG